MENLPLFDGIREEWEARGVNKGRVEGRTDILFDVLEAKFGKVPDSLHNQLLGLKDPEIIRDIVRKAINTKTIEEFTRLVKN